MNLFIDTISNPCNLILFDNNRQIIDNDSWLIKGNESSTLIPHIDKLIKKNNLDYFGIENIVIVNWPWSFTWVRTAVLVANSINYIIKKHITSTNYFDLFNSYPIIKSSSKRDCFIKKSLNSEVEILSNEDLLEYLKDNNVKEAYWEKLAYIEDNWGRLEIFDKIDYKGIISNIKFSSFDRVKPLYIKKPNIS